MKIVKPLLSNQQKYKLQIEAIIEQLEVLKLEIAQIKKDKYGTAQLPD